MSVLDGDTRTIFDISRPGRTASAQLMSAEAKAGQTAPADIPAQFLRSAPPGLPEVSELQVVRHFTNLSGRNFAIDKQFYPLGSCTMKYNPRGAHAAASLPGLDLALDTHAFSMHYERVRELLDELKTLGAHNMNRERAQGLTGRRALQGMLKAYETRRENGLLPATYEVQFGVLRKT